MGDYHKNKYFLEGMTFGEYWNLAGCDSSVVALSDCDSSGKRHPSRTAGLKCRNGMALTTDFCPDVREGKSCVRFVFENRTDWNEKRNPSPNEVRGWSEVVVPLDAKIKIKDNAVTTKALSGDEVTLEFYDLVPSKNPLE